MNAPSLSLANPHVDNPSLSSKQQARIVVNRFRILIAAGETQRRSIPVANITSTAVAETERRPEPVANSLELRRRIEVPSTLLAKVILCVKNLVRRIFNFIRACYFAIKKPCQPSPSLDEKKEKLLQPSHRSAEKKKTISTDSMMNRLQSELELDANRAVREELYRIANHELQWATGQLHQLREMESLLTRIAAQATDPELNALISKVKHASETLTGAVAPSWRDNFETLTEYLKLTLPNEGIFHSNKSILTSRSGTALDDEIFAQIQAEPLLAGTEFEHHSDLRELQHLLSYFKQHREQLQGRAWYGQLIKMTEDACNLYQVGELDKDIDNHRFTESLSERNNRFRQVLKEIIESLKPGENTLLPAGWTKGEGRCSVKMGIERQTDGLLKITLYNMNAKNGIAEYHAELKKKGQVWYQPFIEVADIAPDVLLNPNFTRSYLEQNCVRILPESKQETDCDSKDIFKLLFGHVSTHPESKQETDYSPKDLYDLVLDGLGGRVISSQGDLDKYILPSSEGTGAWSSLLAVLCTKLSRREYYELLSEISLDSLCSFYQSSKNELSYNDTKRYLLQQAISHSSQVALEAVKANAISTDHLKVIHDTIKEAARALELAEKDNGYHRAANKLTIEEPPGDHTSTTTITVPQRFDPILRNTTLEDIIALQSKTTRPEPFIFEWLRNPKHFLDGLTRLHHHLCQYHNETTDTGIRCLEEFFTQLAHVDRLRICDELPQEHVQEAIVKLADINELLLDAKAKFPQNNNAYIAYAFTSNSLMARLYQRDSDHPDKGIPLDKAVHNRYFERDSNSHRGFTKDRNLYSAEARELRRQMQADFLEESEQYVSYFCPYIWSAECGQSIPSDAKKTANGEFLDWDARYIAYKLDHDNTFLDRFKSVYSLTEEQAKAKNYLIALGLCDLYGKVLPPAFCAMRRQFLITHYLLPEPELTHGKGRKFDFQPVASSDPEKCAILNLYPLIEGGPKEEAQDTGKHHQFDVVFSPIKTAFSAQKFRDFISPNIPASLLSIRKGQNWRFRGEHKLVDHRSEADMMFSADREERNIALLLAQGSIKYPNVHIWAHQLPKALAYFLENFELLSNHDSRMFARHLIFERSHIEYALDHNPNLTALLRQFVEKGLKTFALRDDMAATSYFSEIGRALDAIIKKKDLKSPFPDLRSTMVELLRTKRCSLEERTALYQEIAASYLTHRPSSFGREDAALLLTAMLHQKVYPRREGSKATQQTVDEINRSFFNYSEQIKTLMKGKEASAICDQVFSALLPNAKKQTWKCNYPLSISADGQYILNAETAQFFVNCQALTGLPSEILQSELYRRIFGNASYPCTLLHDGCYEFTNSKGHLCQVGFQKVDGSQQLIVRRKVDNAWFQFMSPSQLLCDGAFSSLPNDLQTLCTRSSLWISLNHQAPHTIDLYDSQDNLTHQMDIECPQYNRLEQSPEQDKSTPRTAGAIKAIYKIGAHGERWSLVNLKSAQDCPLKQICVDALLWKDDICGQLMALNRMDIDLSFDINTVDGITRAYCQEHPGYYISVNQVYEGILSFPRALVLENGEGKRKLILPLGQIASTGFLSCEVGGPLPSPPFLPPPPPAMAFDLDTKQRPVATDPDQKLYLAGIFLKQKQYSEAQKLLRASHSPEIRKSRLYPILAKEITTSVEEDSSPHAAAVLTTALAEWLKDKAMPREIVMEMANLLVDRYSQLHSIPHLISLKERKTTLKLLSKRLTEMLHSERSEKEKVLLLLNCIQGYLSGLKHENDVIDDQTELMSIDLTRSEGTRSSDEVYVTLLKQLRSLPNRPSTEKRTHLITRPYPSFQNNFLSLYDLSRNIEKHTELKILLAGASRKSENSRPLVALIKASAREAVAAANSSSLSYLVNLVKRAFVSNDYPADSRALLDLVNNPEREREFLALLKRAEEDERTALLALPKSAAELKGIPNGKKRSEAQTIEQRREFIPPFAVSPLPTPQPLMDSSELSKMFESIPKGGVHLNKEDVALLQKAINGNAPSKQSEALCAHVQNFWSQASHSDPWHRLAPAQLPKVKSELVVKHAALRRRTKAIKRELLHYANQLPNELQKALFFEVEKLGQQRQDVTLKDLVLFTARSRHFTVTNKNPKLYDQEQALLQMCLVYLDSKTQEQQANRALASLFELESLDLNDPNYNRISEACYANITRIRPYQAHAWPECLVFEAMENIGLYDWQISDLERMIAPPPDSNPNVIVEKVMGAGKTKVYLPILALSKADGDHLSLVVVHSSQYDTVFDAMSTKSGQIFAQTAHTLEFSRDSDSSLSALQDILKQCQKVRKNRDFLVVTDKTLHNLTLTFDLLWDQYLASKESDPNLKERIVVMREILSLFKEKGRATLDEADLLLNSRYETVYAIGDKQPIEAVHREVVGDMFACLSSFLEGLSPYTDATYEELKPQLIDLFVQQVVANKMPSRNLDKIRDYLRTNGKGDKYVDELSKNERQVLAIVRNQLQDLLPAVLCKRCGEHYGYIDDVKKKLPVPFLASGVPNPTAEYAFPYALLDYAVLTMEKQGVAASLMTEVLSKLRIRARNEVIANPKLALPETAAYQEFVGIVGEGSSIPFYNPSDKEIARLASAIREHPQRYEFAKKYLFPLVKLHPRKLTSTPYTLVNMFDQVIGFTGTPWNCDTYPKKLITLRDVQTAGKTLGIAWKNSKTVIILPTADAKSAEQLVTRMPLQKYHSFIDVSAIFNGLPNRDVAVAMLNTLPQSIRGIVFFDNNKQCVLERGKGDIIPRDQCSLKDEQLFVYYDQWHTTGTDIRIAGRSLLSVGRNTKIRDLEQGYMRDRSAEFGSRIDFIMTDEDAHCMKEMLHLHPMTSIGPQEIIRCLELNQEQELEEQMLMAAFASIRETVDQHLRSMRLDPAIDPEKLKEEGANLRELLGEPTLDDPYEQFGRRMKEENVTTFFGRAIDRIIQRAHPLINLSKGSLTDEKLRTELWGCFRFDLLPKTIPSTTSQMADQLVEKQSQHHTHQQAMVEKHVQANVSEGGAIRGPLFWNWKVDWDTDTTPFDAEYYQFSTPKNLRQAALPSRNYRIFRSNLLSSTFHSNLQPPRESPQRGLKFWKKKSDNPTSIRQVPILTLQSVLADNSEVQKFADVFDLEASFNFVPIVGRPSIPIFAPQQQYVNNLLVRRNRRTGAVSVTLISEADAAFFFEELATKQAKMKDSHLYDVTLYHTTLGALQYNGEPIPTHLFLDKIVQAKFFNGNSIYSEEEFALLQKWIVAKDKEKMHKLFTEHILRYKEDRRIEYKESVLQTFFEGKK